MKALIAGSMLLLSFQSVADTECGHLVSDTEINKCVAQETERADATLDGAFNTLLDELQLHSEDNPHALEARELLVHAQRQWADFRKTDCDARFALNQGGSVRIPAYQLCMTDHAQQREQQLKAFLD